MLREKGPFDGESTLVRELDVVAGAPSGQRAARLQLVQGPGTPREFTLHGDEVVLGRSHQASICIESGLLSRRHCVVRRSGVELRLIDLDSANGVFVNGIRVHSVVLCEGDAIQIGDAVLVFREGI